MENKKVKNAKRVDLHGRPVTNVSEHRKKYGKFIIIFQSKLERYLYVLLQSKGLAFEYEPAPMTLVQKQTAWAWEHTESKLKDLKAILRTVLKKRRPYVKRQYNANVKKTLRTVDLPPWRYTPDFRLFWYPFDFIIDTKGHTTDKNWRQKYKLILQGIRKHNETASQDERQLIFLQLQTRKEINDFIDYLHKSAKETDINRVWWVQQRERSYMVDHSVTGKSVRVSIQLPKTVKAPAFFLALRRALVEVGAVPKDVVGKLRMYTSKDSDQEGEKL